MTKSESRHFILQIALKCADISNPCRPWEISRKWAYKVCEEFFRQGDYERQLNLPVTPVCDRSVTSIPKIQTGFFTHVVLPLYEEWHRFLADSFSNELMSFLHSNQRQWEAMIAKEAAEETRTEISEFDDRDEADVTSNSCRLAPSSPCLPEEAEGEESGDCPRRLSIVVTPDITSRPPLAPRRASLPGNAHSLSDPRTGRRHSVPLSVARIATPGTPSSNSTTTKGCAGRHHRTPQLRLDDVSLLGSSSLSLLSSRSSVNPESSTALGSAGTERPVSAENLLPDTSIASITSCKEASRISSVLQPLEQRLFTSRQQLTRQQTFPPVQQQAYTRARYMSTTAEMTACEVLVEGDSSAGSSSVTSPARSASPGGTSAPSLCGDAPVQEQASSRRRASAYTESKSTNLEHPRRHSLQVCNFFFFSCIQI